MSLEKRQIARQFSRAAATYDEVAELQSTMADRLIARIEPAATSATQTLVDFGCGTGEALEKLFDATELQLVGIDLAAGMIEMAGRRFENHRRVSLFVGDLERTGLATDSCDWIFSNAVLQWCDSHTAFAEMARVLKPSGKILVSTFGPQTMHQWKTAWHAIGDVQTRVHDFQSVLQLEQDLRRAGFEKIQIESEIHSLRSDSVEAMFANIKRLGATNASAHRATGMLGRDKFRGLKDHFQQRLDRDGMLQTSFECIFVAAVHPKNQSNER